MNKFLKITLGTILFFSIIQCEKNDKSDKANVEVEYFECKINGVDFETVSFPFGCNGLKFDYYPQQYLTVPEGYALLSGSNCDSKLSIAIRVYGLSDSTGYLNFMEPTFADSIFPYYRYSGVSDSIFIVYENLLAGEMNIEQFVARQNSSSPYGTIKGTFNFTLTDTAYSDTIYVSDGRFRFDVPQIF